MRQCGYSNFRFKRNVRETHLEQSVHSFVAFSYSSSFSSNCSGQDSFWLNSPYSLTNDHLSFNNGMSISIISSENLIP